MVDSGPATIVKGTRIPARADDPRAIPFVVALSGFCDVTVATGAAPQNGLTQASKITCLEDLIVGTKYVMLFTDMPDAGGFGGIELTAAWYARIAHSGWITESTLNLVRRINLGQIDFAEVTTAATVVGWGIISAAGGGDLIAFGRLRDTNGNPITVNLLPADLPRFLDLQLKTGIQ